MHRGDRQRPVQSRLRRCNGLDFNLTHLPSLASNNAVATVPSSTQVRRADRRGFGCVGVQIGGSGERLEARTVVVPIAVAGTTVPGIARASGDYTVHGIGIPRSTPEPDADPTAVIRLQMRRFVRDICATYGHGGR